MKTIPRAQADIDFEKRFRNFKDKAMREIEKEVRRQFEAVGEEYFRNIRREFYDRETKITEMLTRAVMVDRGLKQKLDEVLLAAKRSPKFWSRALVWTAAVARYMKGKKR